VEGTGEKRDTSESGNGALAQGRGEKTREKPTNGKNALPLGQRGWIIESKGGTRKKEQKE